MSFGGCLLGAPQFPLGFDLGGYVAEIVDHSPDARIVEPIDDGSLDEDPMSLFMKKPNGRRLRPAGIGCQQLEPRANRLSFVGMDVLKEICSAHFFDGIACDSGICRAFVEDIGLAVENREPLGSHFDRS